MIYFIIIAFIVLVIAGIFALSHGEGDKFYNKNNRSSNNNGSYPNFML